MSGAGKLTAFLVLAFAAVCASTSIDNPIDWSVACPSCWPECTIGLQGIDFTHVCGQLATGDTPPTLPGDCTDSGMSCLTCIIETSCSGWACADESNKCNEEEYEKCDSENIKNKCKKTCGLCELSPSPEPGSGPDICADKSTKCKKKKCKKYSKKKKNKCKKTCGLCEPSQSPEPVLPDICADLKDNEYKCKMQAKKCEKAPKKCKKKCKRHKKTKKWCKESCCYVLAYASPSPPPPTPPPPTPPPPSSPVPSDLPSPSDSPSPSCDACCPVGTCDGPGDANKQACFDCAACNAEGTACPSS